MRWDILSAYAASISKVLSWVIVSAMLYRKSPDAFAILALVRGTLGVLNYAALGLLPAMIQAFATVARTEPAPVVVSPVPVVTEGGVFQLSYVTPDTTREQLANLNRRSGANDQTQSIYATGMLIALCTIILGAAATAGFAHFSNHLYRIPRWINREDTKLLIEFLGFGLMLRWFSDPAGALIQTRGKIWIDNLMQVVAEFAWVIFSFYFSAISTIPDEPLRLIGVAFCLSTALLLIMRGIAARKITRVSASEGINWQLMRPLITTGLLITVAQLADYLYSPTDYLLINHLLTPLDLRHYAPAVQIDSGLLMLVTALGAVLLPKTALAHAAGNRAIVRKYYLRGTLASAVTLIAASVVIYFASPLIFRVWFGYEMPGTVAILPLILLNTVIGGSSAVGRAILIGIGKTKPFTISVLIAGVTNVIASVVFVQYFHLGLNGIILGTIVAVVIRCGIWMPWYVLRELR